MPHITPIPAEGLTFPCVIAHLSSCRWYDSLPVSGTEYEYLGRNASLPVYADASQIGRQFTRRLYYHRDGVGLDYCYAAPDLVYRMQREGIVYVAGHPELGEDIFFIRDAYYSAQADGRLTDTHDRGTILCDASDCYESEDGTVFYDEDERDHYDESQRNDPSNYRSSYHSGNNNVQYIRFGLPTPKFLVGLEIEKEDGDVLRSIRIDDFHATCPKWRKESDGSLNGSTGFELISPVMELDPEKIMDHLNSNPTLSAHVNAMYSDNCGMHANLSDPIRTPWELFDDLYGYLPVLCALYPNRANNTYCKAIPKHTATQNNDKYQAVTVKSDRVEIRIFPAVTTSDNLRFRLDLIAYMMANPAPNIRLVNFETLEAILSQVHKTDAQRQGFTERVIKYTNILRA